MAIVLAAFCLLSVEGQLEKQGAIATKDCQSLTLEPTSLPFVADRVQWHVYGSTEQIHDSKIGDENVWNCS